MHFGEDATVGEPTRSGLADNRSIGSQAVGPVFLNLSLQAHTGRDAISELHAGMCRCAAVRDSGLFLRDVLARHALGANCVSDLVALPHARSAAVSHLTFAFGRSLTGMAFDARHPAIQLVFLIGVPREAVIEYLRWMAQLVRALRKPEIVQGLLTAATAEDFARIWSCCGPNSP